MKFKKRLWLEYGKAERDFTIELKWEEIRNIIRDAMIVNGMRN